MPKISITSIKKRSSLIIAIVAFTLLIGILVWSFGTIRVTVLNEQRRLNSTEFENAPKIPVEETTPTNQGTLRIGSKTYTFEPSQVETVREDIFNPGYFSMFDVLVHIHKMDKINLQYHFDESMNTHIIDSINGKIDWWYQTYYSGGWLEKNVFRPDHYPWKDKTTLTFYQETPARLERIYSAWKEEITRKNTNNNMLIIPEVKIRSRSFTKTFENVEVTSHNLRNDVFKQGTITAIDTILSLEDKNKISFELQWYERIGSAGIVRSYWVEAINEDRASGRCGFVYEAGSKDFPFFSGNHIHLPSDTRVLNSPEYLEYFWICI